MLKDTESWKRNKLWFIFENKVAWFGFYKQNNKFGNYNKILSSLDEEIHQIRSKLYPSKILGDQTN